MAVGGNIRFLMIFAVSDPSPLTLDKLQFLVLINIGLEHIIYRPTICSHTII